MAFEDLTGGFASRLPDLRGKLKANAELSGLTWFRTGGPAQLLFTPADAEDLAYFLARIPSDWPVRTLGLGSNMLIRDGGIKGVVIKLGSGLAKVTAGDACTLTAGAAATDMKVARTAASAGIGGLTFFRGVPGCVGGALRMNAGAHGTETKDVLIEARGVDRAGRQHVFTLEDMDFSYRHCGVPSDIIFTEATFRGQPQPIEAIKREMQEVADYRAEHQPTTERTGGSTFRNPPGHSAWRLVDEAGLRGFRVGGAKVSELHCNFLINDADATAENIEQLGETIRARVKENSSIELQWEIIRVGEALPGQPTGAALALPDASATAGNGAASAALAHSASACDLSQPDQTQATQN